MDQQKYTRTCLSNAYTEPPLKFSQEAIWEMKTAGTYDNFILHNTPEAQQKRIAQALEILNRLPLTLQSILDSELNAKNKVTDVSLGYPHADSICVTLAQRFKQQYVTSTQLKYELTNDPHYWYAHYATLTNPVHMIICEY